MLRHQELYDPSAKRSIRRCKLPEGAGGGDPECWVETVNPTAIHEAEVRVHSDRAVFHRKAARDLRAAEIEACAGLPASVRDSNPFGRSTVLGVSPIEDPPSGGKKEGRVVGSTVFLQAVAGLTVAELQKQLDCFSAHQAVIGYGLITTSADRSPLGEPGSRALVRESAHGYAVEVRADDPFAAQAIWLRTQNLAVVD